MNADVRQVGGLISPYYRVHTNMPIVKEIDTTTTKKQGDRTL